MTKQVRADLLLLTVTLCWGVSYLLIDRCLLQMGPFTLNTWRFLLAFLAAAVISFPRLRHPTRATLRYATLLGALLVSVYAFATFGVRYTSLSNAGFLCGLSTILTPLFACILYRRLPSKKLAFCILLCFFGTALLTLSDGTSFTGGGAKGNLLCAGCGVVYSFHLLLTERAVRQDDVDAYQLGVYQLLICGVCNLALAFLTETPTAPAGMSGWAMTVFLAVFCTGLAFVAQALAQKHTSATHAGIIFSLEQVFSAIVAFLFAHEVLRGSAYLGALLMVASVFVMELNLKKKVG